MAIALARQQRAKIIINDRVDIALALRADGIHLGQTDLPPEYARKILGPDAIIGFSTHSIEQAVVAARLPVDYLAIGPVFSTNTKENPAPAIGLDRLRDVREAVGDLPLVAIGGITLMNLPGVFETGVDSAAMVGALISDPATITVNFARFGSLTSK